MNEPANIIAANLARIRERIAVAAKRVGRDPDPVTLVAVTKYVGPEEIRGLVQAGCIDIGESRPQELWKKAEALTDLPIRWHLVGHLQRNKVQRTIPMVAEIHSVDSQRLLAAIDQAAGKLGRRIDVLLEVNVSGEKAKHGFSPSELESALPSLAELREVRVRGLMTMAGLEGGLERARADFRRLRELRDKLQAAAPENIALDELSMGMSGDFEAAIEEGATIVRVGSALFEGLPTLG